MLKVLNFNHKVGNKYYDDVICDCGNQFTIRRDRLIKQNNCNDCANQSRKSKNTKHGDWKSYLYECYHQINQRCNNPNKINYKDYGGRGIKLYEKWNTYESFKEYIINNLGERPSSDYSLDRINNNGHYEPGNVRWATRSQQQRNKRNSKN
jgi:hypothetical protein